MSTLRDRMVGVMKICNLTAGTQAIYLDAVRGLATHYGRSPDALMREEVQDHLLYLIEDRGYAHSTYNCHAAGLRFFFGKVLGRTDVPLWIPRRRAPQKLPEILCRQELDRLFAAATNPKHHALLVTTYAAGLRVSEAVHLQLADIDSGRMVIRVRQGKGRKDRETVLSKALLTELRSYWKQEKPSPWLFPGEDKEQPMTTGTALRIYTEAKERAGITKVGGIHCLRHCFAVGLLEQGVDVRTIQMLMGHSSILSTSRYLRLTAGKVGEEHSLLDLIRVPEEKEGPAKKK